MIALLGDIHGSVEALLSGARSAHKSGATLLIQVGDFGVYPSYFDALCEAADLSPIPIYFIDGNHEHYPMVRSWPSSTPTTFGTDLTYIPRGTVLELDGLRVGFLGGAGSIDYAYRTAGGDWFPDDEQIKDHEVERLVASGPVDVLVTHTPPRSVIDQFFDTTPAKAASARRMFGAALDWTDPSADKVQAAWDALNRPMLYCGHMHRAISLPGVRVLNINELVLHKGAA